MKPVEPLNIDINSRHLDDLESESIYILREVAAGCANPALLFSALVCLAVMGLILFTLIRLADYYFVPWARKDGSDGN